ncbi:MAG: methyltransferase domain-containing protein [Flavobacteriales bacterium]
MGTYLHGYDQDEFHRLVEQAEFLGPEIFQEIDLSFSTRLLEPGCGAGAQTRYLTQKAPNAQILSFDVAEAPIAFAKHWLSQADERLQKRIEFRQAEAAELRTDYANFFDACYICWMLEHVTEPAKLLKEIYPLLQQGAKIFVTEVQNNTLTFYPPCPLTMRVWKAICDHQQAIGGDPFVGEKCASYLSEAGYDKIEVKPHQMIRSQVDHQNLHEMIQYWIKLMFSAARFLDVSLWDGVENELAVWMKHPDAQFSYTFVQSFATKP